MGSTSRDGPATVRVEDGMKKREFEADHDNHDTIFEVGQHSLHSLRTAGV